VLEVGCGTGRLAAALTEHAAAKVWAVDPSPEMVAVARNRARRVAFRQAAAEQLPFKPGAFERALATLVVHVLDRPRAFAEIRRVLRPDGRVVFATFDPSQITGYWMNRFFPSMLAVDLPRFAPADVLVRELRDAGFKAARATRHSQKNTIDRETALARIRGRHISTFDLLDESEIEAGLKRAEAELPEEVEYASEWLVVVASCSSPR
jgi:ubiquinone/menaquinone biosynthesis C-methylase UbiE